MRPAHQMLRPISSGLQHDNEEAGLPRRASYKALLSMTRTEVGSPLKTGTPPRPGILRLRALNDNRGYGTPSPLLK